MTAKWGGWGIETIPEAEALDVYIFYFNSDIYGVKGLISDGGTGTELTNWYDTYFSSLTSFNIAVSPSALTVNSAENSGSLASIIHGSIDFGLNWTEKITTGSEPAYPTLFAVDHTNRNLIWCALASQSGIVLRNWVDLTHTEDGGLTWATPTRYYFSGDIVGNLQTQIAACHDGENCYLSVYSFTDGLGTLYRTMIKANIDGSFTDPGAESFSYPGNDNKIYSMYADPTSTDDIYGFTNELHSFKQTFPSMTLTDLGTWTDGGGYLNFTKLCITNAGTIVVPLISYSPDWARAYLSTNGGASFTYTDVTSFFPSGLTWDSATVAYGSNDNIVWCTGDGKIVFSIDEGITFYATAKVALDEVDSPFDICAL